MGYNFLKKSNLIKTLRYLRKNGVRHTYYAARERIGEERQSDYHYTEPSEEVLEKQRKESAACNTVFSIVVPAYETDERFLRKMIESVLRQSYEKWELIIADASRDDGTEKIVKEISCGPCGGRIRYMRLTENKGISGNTNAGIALASGDYTALLDHDDFLAPDALYHMAAALDRARRRGAEPALLYTDEDKYDDGAHRYISPHNKKKFNLDLILSNNYICHFMAVKSELLKELGLRSEYDGAQDYDLVLRIIGRLLGKPASRKLSQEILHVPGVLYHWRCHTGSTADNTASKSYAYEAGLKALESFCTGQGWRVTVEHGLHLGFYEITYLPDLFSVRTDVGIVGGRILDRRGRICAGAMDEDGNCLFEGLYKEYSGGSTHLASVKQDVCAVDVRCMQVRPEMREVFEQITGLPYGERTVRCAEGKAGNKMRIADVTGLSCDEAGYRKLSMELGLAAAQCGYRVLWDPQMSCRLDG